MNKICKQHGKRAFKAGLMLTAALLCACSQQDGELPQGKGLRLQVSAGGFTSDTPGTRTSEDGYATSFSPYDDIGVFAISGSSTILDDNLRYTYYGSSWETMGEAIQGHPSATYFAYYPYSEAMSGKTSVDDIFAAFTPHSDQYYNYYFASDLMTGSGTVSAGVLSFSLSHRLALVEVKLPHPSGMATFRIDGTHVTFYHADSVYRYLLKPAVITLSGVYSPDGFIGRQYTQSLTLTAGTCTRLNVN
jgi:hypothetical protein